MGRLFKWFGIGFGALLILASLAVVIGYLTLRNTVQPLSGTMEIAGLSAPVETVRDAYGIPHIVAETKADALAALGFAHAQDRLWQMEVLRMTGQGRLSEMFGEPTVDIDRFLRSLDFMTQAESSFGALSDTHKSELRAYAEGVNSFMLRQTGALEPRLTPEFMILRHEPEAWKPAHSLLVLKIMSLQLSMNLGQEVTRLKLAAQGLTSDEINDILPMHRDDNPPLLPDLRKLYDLGKPKEKETAGLKSGFEFLHEGGHWASNNWVFSGARTASGKPLLANDPHLGFTAPSLWYLAHLKWQGSDGEYHVIGATIPAFPGVLLGRSNRIAWGFTNAGADVQDLFIEQVDPDNPQRYKAPEGWRDFDIREERILVDGADPVVENMRTSRHGPVLPEAFRGLSNILPKNHVAALAWTGLSRQDPSYAMVSLLSDATSVGEFRRAVARSVAPMQSIVVADIDGNIALMTPASLPIRKQDNDMLGRAPVPGWLGKYDWAGIATGNRLIDIENPSSGALGSANSRLPVETQSNFYTFDWDEPFRTDRVAGHVLAANAKQTVDTMIAGQLDSYSQPMVELRDKLVAALGEKVSRGLVDWDGRMDEAKSEPVFMAAFHLNLLKSIFADELGPVFDTTFKVSGASVLRVLNGKAARDWCDDTGTAAKESCGDMLSIAHEKTIAEIGGAAKKWGEVHTVFNEHRPFSSVWPLSKLFTIERPTSGGNFALLRGKTDFSDVDHPFRATHGAGYRAVYDFADLDKSIFIQTTGQSGNPFSPRYDDMADLWAQGRYVPMTTNPKEYEKGALGTWRLEP